MPSEDKISRLVESKHPAVREVYLDAHRLVREGTSAAVRHVKLRSIEQLADRQAAIKRLLEGAARLNLRRRNQTRLG